VPSVNIHELEAREELANQWQKLIRHVLALRPADEERPFLIPDLGRVLEGKISEVVERLAQDIQRNAKFLSRGALRAVEITKQKLTDGQLLCCAIVSVINPNIVMNTLSLVSCLFESLEDLVRFRLSSDTCLLDLAHSLHVLGEIPAQSRIHGCIVDSYQVGDSVGLLQGECHCCLRAH
jgi:hypothetical protein